MKQSKRMILVALVAWVAVSATACGVSDLVNALSKLQAGQIGALTGNEIRALSEAAAAALNSQNPSLGIVPLTQQQADALVAFLAANNIQTPQDLEDLKMKAQNDPGAIMGLAELAAAFPGVDPNNATPDQLQQVFGQAFGGN